MKTKVNYEWDCETPEPDGSDIYHNHGTLEYVLAAQEPETNVVLVRDVWDVEDEGLLDRAWAYVKDGKLPEFFTLPNAEGEYMPIGIRVPKRFHEELRKAMGQ